LNLLPTTESRKRVFNLSFIYTPAQLKVKESKARFKILRAGRKFGKTTFAEHTALDGLRMPNSTWWHIAPTYKQAKLISWDKFKRIIPPEAMGKKPNDTDLIITLKNGSQLYLMGSDNEDTLRGPQPDGMSLEEAAYHSGTVWEKVLRPNLMPKQGPAYFITTPNGYNWFKKLEDDARRFISEGDKEWEVFHYTCYDNPHISREEIAKARKSCGSDAYWRQEYLAEYESSVGRVFSFFDERKHCQPIEWPSGRFDCWRANDWGMRDDNACLWGFVRNKKLFVYREYAANNLSAPTQAKIVKDQTTARENVVMTAISHDAAKEDPEMKGLTVMWHFRQAGITPLRPSSRDKKHSRSMIQQLLEENRLVIDLYKCPKLRDQMLAYEWKNTAIEKPEDRKPEDGDDDLVDALHYLVEMLQFELFMGRSPIEEKTMPEILASIAAEKLEQMKGQKFKIPAIFDRDTDAFGKRMEDTPAGYI
jgi:Terminase RNaseH-like domain